MYTVIGDSYRITDSPNLVHKCRADLISAVSAHHTCSPSSFLFGMVCYVEVLCGVCIGLPGELLVKAYLSLSSFHLSVLTRDVM